MAFTIKYARLQTVTERWDEIAACLGGAVAVAKGRFSLEDVKQLILDGKYHLLVVEDEGGHTVAALTAAVIGYPQLRALEVSFLGGTGGMEWGWEMLAVVENMAKITGCSRIEFRGRKEWGSVLRREGYEAFSTLYEKAISPCVATASTTAH